MCVYVWLTERERGRDCIIKAEGGERKILWHARKRKMEIFSKIKKINPQSEQFSQLLKEIVSF